MLCEKPRFGGVFFVFGLGGVGLVGGFLAGLRLSATATKASTSGPSRHSEGRPPETVIDAGEFSFVEFAVIGSILDSLYLFCSLVGMGPCRT